MEDECDFTDEETTPSKQNPIGDAEDFGSDDESDSIVFEQPIGETLVIRLSESGPGGLTPMLELLAASKMLLTYAFQHVQGQEERRRKRTLRSQRQIQ